MSRRPRRLARRARQVPLAAHALLVQVRVRRRLARDPDPELLVRALRRGRRRAGGARARSEEPEARLAEARRVAGTVVRALSIVPSDGPCLVRSLVLIDLLARREIPAKLVIGARSDPAFRAHAWVELDGRPLLPPGDYVDSRLVEL